MKLQHKIWKPQETSLIQPSIQPMWANLSIYNLGEYCASGKLRIEKGGGTRQLFSDQGVCVMGKSRRICPSTLNFHTQLPSLDRG